ncbi:hypothetical protein Moror_15230 [Moniliophthora roreri MCA 2997]|uniref:Integral membrane protein n=2 Tax=Moniliophthora roreri TaxID=221103 RepID=V2X622_MONRO|nr:hypothetical protein Moror_15230 [Moniliophthora roreri MCA 2997]
MARPWTLLAILANITLATVVGAATNFNECLNRIKNNDTLRWDLLNNHGSRLEDPSNATAIPYSICTTQCHSGPEAFSWSTLSEELSAWLLPYLALLSQLPYGTQDKLDNLVAMLLTVGSPTLAAYSVAITVLNGRWVARLFAQHTCRNARKVPRILNSLQQAPIRVNPDHSLLDPLFCLPSNDQWWDKLAGELDWARTWSISAATSILWVVVAYIFTNVDYYMADFKEFRSVKASGGQGIGSLWIWLLPIVIAWLQISPKCDAPRLRKAVNDANAIVAPVDTGFEEAAQITSRSRPAILLENNRMSLNADEHRTAPIYNYSRFFSWAAAVETVSASFREHSRCTNQPQHRLLVVPTSGVSGYVDIAERYSESSPEKLDYPEPRYAPRLFATGTWGRMALASLLALGLQWGTAGAAILMAVRTPTTGLACRSGSYLMYAVTSTIVWILLLLSGILSHYGTVSSMARGQDKALVTGIAALLRRTGKTLAACNVVWILVTCIFQFSHFFDRCYCNAGVFARGAKNAYVVVKFLEDDVSSMKSAWIGNIVLATGCAAIFIGFVNTMISSDL